MIELELADDSGLRLRTARIGALTLAIAKLVGDTGHGENAGRSLHICGHVTEGGEDHGDFGHQLEATAEVVGPAGTHLGRSFPQNTETDGGASGFEGDRKGGGGEGRPVLSKKKVHVIGFAESDV